ncbi:hypothetical protein [Brevibacterium sp. UCMA 11754]
MFQRIAEACRLKLAEFGADDAEVARRKIGQPGYWVESFSSG